MIIDLVMSVFNQSLTNNRSNIVKHFNTVSSFIGGRFFMPLLTAAFFFFAAGMSNAQAPVLPFDFESNSIVYTFTDFDGGQTTRIANPVPGGINTSGFVGKMVKNAGQPWGGSWIQMASAFDFSVNKFFKAKVYMPAAGRKMLLKVENETNPAINFEKEVIGTVANGWEELTFDFSAINTSNQYHKLVVIFDLGTMGNGTSDFTYYFDDIRLVPTGTVMAQMNLPVTFDLPNVDYGLVGFGGAEASTIVVDPTLPGNKVGKVIKSATAELWAGTTITTVTGGTQTGFATKVPFTAQEKRMNVRVWSPHAPIQVRLKVEDHTNGTISCETEATLTVANSWQTLVFDFANEAGGTAPLNLANNYNKASIFFNFGVTGATAGERTYYFDDVKFGADIIPVELTSFSAVVNGSSVTLNWATATETNNRGFEIQRSSNNKDFSTVAFINGKGTTTSLSTYSYTDANLSGKYSYRLKQVDLNGTFAYSNTIETEVIPAEFSLGQNYPNPFNPSTVINFSLPSESIVSISIYNAAGQLVREAMNGTMQAGYHQFTFDASGLTSGVYFYSVTASAVGGSESFRSTKKMVLMR